MNWLKECSKLTSSINILDRKKAIEIFATNSILQTKKGDCDNCRWISNDKRSCYNPEIDNCNVFTNSLFVNKSETNNLPTKTVCFFKLKNGKYLTENNIEITTEMLVKYPHVVSDSYSFIIIN